MDNTSLYSARWRNAKWWARNEQARKASEREPLSNAQEAVGGLNYTQAGLRCARPSCLDGAPRRDCLDLSFAFESWMATPVQCEWRTHFHVPVFLDDFGAFKTTRPSIEEARAPQSRSAVSPGRDWDVLPEHLKTGHNVDYVVKELEWVKAQLH
jgi:hypothetical protein